MTEGPRLLGFVQDGEGAGRGARCVGWRRIGKPAMPNPLAIGGASRFRAPVSTENLFVFFFSSRIRKMQQHHRTTVPSRLAAAGGRQCSDHGATLGMWVGHGAACTYSGGITICSGV